MKEKDIWGDSKRLLLHTIMDTIASSCKLSRTDRLVLGVSGGADSTAMLHLLSEIHPVSLLDAVYVDHQLRPAETPDEIKLLSDQCSALKIRFTVSPVDVPGAVEKYGGSTEEIGRQLRYEQLNKRLNTIDGKYICVAHTADDQTEEFFIRLIRGTGTAGLSGMKRLSHNILRPMLALHKTQLEEFLLSHNIKHSEDSSNSDLRFLRNRIRHSLLPFLRDNFNQSIGDTILKTSSILQEEDAYLDSIVSKTLDHVVLQTVNGITINSKLLKQQHKALQRRIIEKSLWLAGTTPTFTTIDNLIDLVVNGERGKEIHLAKSLVAVQQKEDIVLYHCSRENSGKKGLPKPEKFEVNIIGPGSYPVPELQHQLTVTLLKGTKDSTPNSLVLNGESIQFPLTLRTVLPGEKFTPLGMKGRKKVNRYLSDKKIEKIDRQYYPVLVSGNNIVCIAGLQIDNNYKHNTKTKSYLVINWEKM